MPEKHSFEANWHISWTICISENEIECLDLYFIRICKLRNSELEKLLQLAEIQLLTSFLALHFLI